MTKFVSVTASNSNIHDQSSRNILRTLCFHTNIPPFVTTLINVACFHRTFPLRFTSYPRINRNDRLYSFLFQPLILFPFSWKVIKARSRGGTLNPNKSSVNALSPSSSRLRRFSRGEDVGRVGGLVRRGCKPGYSGCEKEGRLELVARRNEYNPRIYDETRNERRNYEIHGENFALVHSRTTLL